MSKQTILVETDENCEMARVSIDGKCVMEGNDWDFHPGCHNILDYGNFKGPHSLARNIQAALTKKKVESEIVYKDYTYGED